MSHQFRTDQVKKAIKIGSKEAPNRIAINAMECNDADENGNPGPKTRRRYKNLFAGGAGVVILEAITVTYDSRGRKNQLSILPRNKKALKQFTEELKEINDDVVFLWQLTHAGELSDPEFSRRVTAKQLPGFEGDLLTEEEVENIMDQYVQAVQLAEECGADGIDFKLCHGYLGSQLLRPYNDRDWKFGGSWNNRSRFAYETLERMIDAVQDPDFVFGSKISLWEGFPGGQGSAGPDTAVMDLEEPLKLVKGLEERGADFILESAGSPSITLALAHPDHRIPKDVYLHHTFQQKVSEIVDPETVVIGSGYSAFRNGENDLQAVKKEENTLPYWANKNIEDGVVDMVAIGRQSLADPHFPRKLLNDEHEDINWCTLCDSCIEFLIRQQDVGCAIHNEQYADSFKDMREEYGKLSFKRT